MSLRQTIARITGAKAENGDEPDDEHEDGKMADDDKDAKAAPKKAEGDDAAGDKDATAEKKAEDDAGGDTGENAKPAAACAPGRVAELCAEAGAGWLAKGLIEAEAGEAAVAARMAEVGRIAEMVAMAKECGLEDAPRRFKKLSEGSAGEAGHALLAALEKRQAPPSRNAAPSAEADWSGAVAHVTAQRAKRA